MSSKYNTEIDKLDENSSHGKILSSIRLGSTVLECGSATGYMTKYMKEQLSAKVSIVELDAEAFQQAREFAEDGICADLDKKEWYDYYQGQQFDYILFADVLEHLRNPQLILQRAVSLLKADGTIIVSIPNVAHADILINLLNNRWNYLPLGLLDNTHIYFWAAENLQELFTKAGLSLVEKDYVISPAYTTEQKNSDRTDGLESAIYSICQRPFSDVYQFVFKAQKDEYIKACGKLCIDRYAERHWTYGKMPPVCVLYKEKQEREAKQIESILNLLKLKTETLTGENSQIVSTWEQLREKEEKLINLQEEKSLLVGRNKELKAAYEDLQRQYNDVRLSYDTISNAFFWKLSKPLRLILDKEKSRFKDNKFAHSIWHALKWIRWGGNIPEPPVPPLMENSLFYYPGDPMTVLCTKHTWFIGQLIQNSLKRAGFVADILMDEPTDYSENVYIVVCPQMFQRLPSCYISFQMEQTISSRWLDEKYIKRLEHSFAVFDYSLMNIDYFQKTVDFSRKFYYLPVDYLPGIRRETGNYAYDVVFYGDPNNDRRQAALKKLSQRFKVKILSEVFGEQLYTELCRAKIVVNIHYYENAMLETTRLYETLSLGRSIIVSERSVDTKEDERLEGFVDFVPVNEFDSMADRVSYWLTHEEERKAAVELNNDLLTHRASAFDYYFLRFLLANDWLSFDDFYRLAGDYVHFATNHVCISLPESLERAKEFRAEIRDKKINFEIFPALRHKRGWTGCGLSYKFIMKKAQEQGMDGILVCEDDVLLPDDFDYRWSQCESYLNSRDDWDLFQGLMSNIGDVSISAVRKESGQTFVHLNHMISMVFNYYRNNMFSLIIMWDERDDDVNTNTIDRALESQELRVVCTNPFLVGHKENLNSVIWGFKNSQYNTLIESSSMKLDKLVKRYEAKERKEK